MEIEKVLILREEKSFLTKTEKILDRQEMEIEKVLILKEEKVFSKKITQNQLDIQIIQNTLKKKL